MTVLPFVTRAEYDARDFTEKPDGTPFTPDELYRKLLTMVGEHMDTITAAFKCTNRFNPTADQLVHRAFENMHAACSAIAGVREYGQARQTPQASVAFPGHVPVRLFDANLDGKRHDDCGGFDNPDTIGPHS